MLRGQTNSDMHKVLPAFDEQVLFALERRYIEPLALDALELADSPCRTEFVRDRDVRFLQLQEVTYSDQRGAGMHVENMQNVLASVYHAKHNLVMAVHGAGPESRVYYGVAKNYSNGVTQGSNTDAQTASALLRSALAANYHSTTMRTLDNEAILDELLVPMREARYLATLPGIPSSRKKDADGPQSQGIDRFIEAMRGEEYLLLCVAEPIALPGVDDIIRRLFSLGGDIHTLVKATIQKTKGSSDTLNVGVFGMRGVSDARTEGTSTTETTSESETRMGTGGVIMAAGPAAGAAAGMVTGAVIGSIVPGVGTVIGGAVGGLIGGLAGPVAAMISGAPLNTTLGHASSFTRSVASTVGNMAAGGGFGGYARSWTRSMSISQETLDKQAEYAERLCDRYVQRLQAGKNMGLWNVGVYVFSKDRFTMSRAASTMRSVLAADETHWEPLRCKELNKEDVTEAYLARFHNPRYNLFEYGGERRAAEQAANDTHLLIQYLQKLGKKVKDARDWLLRQPSPEELLRLARQEGTSLGQDELDAVWQAVQDANVGHPLGPVMGGVATPLNTEELSYIVNVPQQEVQGVSVRKTTAFHGNMPLGNMTDRIALGRVVHKDRPDDQVRFSVERNSLVKHGFICGVTGSGKTTTCRRLLADLATPFLVIEPAKEEYRQLLNSMPDLKVFTLGDETGSPFRLNPFAFAPGTSLLTHVDGLRTVFNSSFPMYASMPYILEEAIIDVYMDKGWELAASTNRYFDVAACADWSDYLPTLSDLFEKIDEVVNRKKYAQQLNMDISAALKARLSSLRTGSKGLMLDTRRSVPFSELLHGRVVLELRSLGDDEEKAFMMGLVLMHLYEYRLSERDYRRGVLRHLTLIEEAHRLLKRVPEHVSSEVANVRGKAVETFSNIISEIREYGEGVLVVDQIPAKMTQDVLKNTSLKIVHRTLALDDRDNVGGTMSLTDEQSGELSLLPVGRAVISHDTIPRPFLVQIDPEEKTSERVSNETLKLTMTPWIAARKEVYSRVPGCERDESILARFPQLDFRRFDVVVYHRLTAWSACLLIGDEMAFAATRQELVRTLLAHALQPVDCDCLFLWYLDRLCSNLNRAYCNRYDKVLQFQRQAIDIWFGQARTPDTVAISATLREISDNQEDCEPFVRWFVASSESCRELRERLAGTSSGDVYADLDEFLGKAVVKFLCGITPTNVATLKEAILRQVLQDHPSAPAILRRYRSHVTGQEE